MLYRLEPSPGVTWRWESSLLDVLYLKPNPSIKYFCCRYFPSWWSFFFLFLLNTTHWAGWLEKMRPLPTFPPLCVHTAQEPQPEYHRAVLCKLSFQDSQCVLSPSLIGPWDLTGMVDSDENNIRASESRAFSVSLQLTCGLALVSAVLEVTKVFGHSGQSPELSGYTSHFATFVFRVSL